MKNLTDFLSKALSINENYTAVNAKDDEDMVKQFAKLYKISDNDIETLLYVVHSDDHVEKQLKPLITKLQKNGEVPEMTLYRGCSDKEYNAIIKTGKSPVATLSFSEDKNLAKDFGENVIEVEVDVPMFCYHKFMGDWYATLKKVNPHEYDSVDGDFMIETAEEELEWICTNDYKFVADGSVFKLTK